MASHTHKGFTVIEILFIVVILGVASVLFFVQKNNISVIARDDQRKIAINAMYYSLEEVFYPKNKYYPTSIDASVLPSVDPTLMSDPFGIAIGDGTSDYRYEGLNCVENKCTSYTLRAALENEDDFIKTSRNN